MLSDRKINSVNGWTDSQGIFTITLQDGELVLLDGGCESSCYVSDITRTWPINGRYAVIRLL